MSLAQISRILLGRFASAITALWHDLIGPLGNPYRPELHYMRGPGPKWHAKHRPLDRSLNVRHKFAAGVNPAATRHLGHLPLTHKLRHNLHPLNL